MANKQSFKPEEWTKILESTMLAGMAVSAAEPSGLLGSLKEAVASSSTLAKAKSDAGANELVKAVVSDFETKRASTDDPKRKSPAHRYAANHVFRTFPSPQLSGYTSIIRSIGLDSEGAERPSRD